MTLHDRAASFATAWPDVAKYGGGLRFVYLGDEVPQ